jgi:IS30 family transposase
MDCNHYTTETRKGQHLSYEERVTIELRLKDGWNINQIAKDLNRSYNAIKKEIARGTVLLYHGKVKRYKARAGQVAYELNRKRCVKTTKLLECLRFIHYVEQHFEEDKWSLDACAGHALESGEFSREEIVCTKTLYNYVDAGFMHIKNIDLPEKVSRKLKHERVRQNKRKLGDSIEERPESIERREEFGHWEFDSVLGQKGGNEPVVVTMVERMTRQCIWLRVENHTANALMDAVHAAFEQYKGCLNRVFKSITADNGSEFARLSELKEDGIAVYFTHPYSSFEKGTNECHNRMLRRFIPKGKSIVDYSQEDITYFADVINGLPRKRLRYRTPEALFEQELDRIYALNEAA